MDGLRPKVHRLMSPGHDPVLGFIFGVTDIMKGTGTYIDKNGDWVRLATSMSPEGLTTAFLKVFLHLLSDMGTSAGIQPPFFTLLSPLTKWLRENSGTIQEGFVDSVGSV